MDNTSKILCRTGIAADVVVVALADRNGGQYKDMRIHRQRISGGSQADSGL